MELEDRITIQTPEGVELELTLAGLGSRATATIIDGLIKAGVLIAALIFSWLLSGLSDEGKTVIIASHDPLVIESRPGCRVIELKDGKIAPDDS